MQLLVPLYELRPYDESDPRWSPLFFREQVTGDAAASTYGTPQSPPANKAWIITGATLQGSPDAAKIFVSSRLRVQPFGAAANADPIAEPVGLRPNPPTAAATTALLSVPLNLILVGGVHQITVHFGWNPGFATNVGIWSIWGYEIPRGNVALR